MLKKFSCLALLGMAFSLNAMEPSLIDISASAQKLGAYDELTNDQKVWLDVLDRHIEEYLVAPSHEKNYAYDGLSRWVKTESAALVGSFLKIPLPSTQRGISGSRSLYDKVQALIEENKKEIRESTFNDALVERKSRLEDIKELLDIVLDPQSSAETTAPKAAQPRRSGPAKSNGGKGGFFSGITRNHVLVTLGVLGASYVVWKKFLTTSDEDKK